MSDSDEFQLVKQELLQAVRHYIERQKIVHLAITDLGLSVEAIEKFRILA